MKLKPFFVDALTSALELGIGRPEDVLKHVTPDVLSVHLPRPLWARLITACLGAPKVDATLIVETIGIPNLVEHVPATIIWGCIADIAGRSLGRPEPVVAPKPEPKPEPVVAAKPVARQPLTPPPPEATPQPVRASSSQPVATGPAIPSPLADIVAELESEIDKPPVRSRTPTSQRFRTSNTGINRPIGSAGLRRPQVQATPATPARPTARRGSTEISETENETSVDPGNWAGREIAVDDSQLVDWQSDSSTASGTTDDDFSDIGRKR